jgi:ABC-type uncharacterized transport system auxiliary subunit
MRRRAWLAGAVGLAGCSVLPEQPYLQKRDWPLAARRGSVLPPRRSGPVLLVRSVQPAPGLETRGLQWVLPDGSLHVDYYEQWAVPPAQATEDSLRQWLADAGLFAAVVAPGSRLPADLVLEGELTAFVGDPRAGVARAGLALVLMDERPKPVRVLLQTTESAEVPLSGTQPPVVAQALVASLADVLRRTEADVAAVVGR